MLTRHHFAIPLACLALCAGLPSALAAPLAAEPSKQELQHDGEDAAEQAPTDWAAGAVPGTGRTMELLLEMQKKDPGPRREPEAATAGVRSALGRPGPGRIQTAPASGLDLGAPAVASQRPAVPAGPTSAASPAPVLFGTQQAAPIEATASPSADWQATSGSNESPVQRQYRPASEVQRWVLLPSEFIAWLRENRYAVVAGAVATLVLVWGGGALISRRRYAH
jgi:hypothetical protein